MVRKKSSEKNSKYRSKFEERLAGHLAYLGFKYEPIKLDYTIPETKHKYTPDFVRGKLIYELKGRWTAQDRKKMRLLVEQHPEYEIIMVFQNPNIKISKGSKTSYADYCDKFNIKWMYYKELLNAN